MFGKKTFLDTGLNYKKRGINKPMFVSGASFRMTNNTTLISDEAIRTKREKQFDTATEKLHC